MRNLVDLTPSRHKAEGSQLFAKGRRIFLRITNFNFGNPSASQTFDARKRF